MFKPAASRNVVAVIALGVLAPPVALLSACSPPGEVPSKSPGTTPSIWTGSPEPTSTPAAGGAATSESLTTRLRTPDGTEVATAKFEFNNGYVTVTVQTTNVGKLTPGFHGLHVHQVGKCEPNSVAPGGGAPGNFLSAGGHYQAPGHTGEPASGDLTSLQIRDDGAGLLVTTTDAFTKDDLLSGTALIIHGASESIADAGKRVACGVIGAG
ncbi:superoxide dismutase family protein [Mycobacterium sp.]|uniref:superoxide dismutase[Cu-Zn] n=1 Tax=Mycobacterium sp. TaxID=1785 RepID=UPI00126FA37D|nr:superoxide dismutase family protein [Mycobacterium sp.]KAA8966897.1 MAG: superoxide dismutase [Mycobacterium sp.]